MDSPVKPIKSSVWGIIDLHTRRYIRLKTMVSRCISPQSNAGKIAVFNYLHVYTFQTTVHTRVVMLFVSMHAHWRSEVDASPLKCHHQLSTVFRTPGTSDETAPLRIACVA